MTTCCIAAADEDGIGSNWCAMAGTAADDGGIGATYIMLDGIGGVGSSVCAILSGDTAFVVGSSGYARMCMSRRIASIRRVYPWSTLVKVLSTWRKNLFCSARLAGLTAAATMLWLKMNFSYVAFNSAKRFSTSNRLS